MKATFILLLGIASFTYAADHLPEEPKRPAAGAPTGADACHAITRATKRIQNSVDTLANLGKTCFTCHHNTLTLATFSAAHRAGLMSKDEFEAFRGTNLSMIKDDLSVARMHQSLLVSKIDRALGEASEQLKGQEVTPALIRKILAASPDPELKKLTEKDLDDLNGKEIHGDVSTVGSALAALREAGDKPGALSHELVEYLLTKQKEDGSWEPSEKRRVPSEGSSFQATALALAGLDTFGELSKNPEREQAFKKGVQWLLSPSAAPVDTEDRVGRLTGLVTLRDSSHLDVADKAKVTAAIREASGELLKRQKADGGWAQTSELGSDAYATGHVLVALAKAGVSPRAEAYGKGAAFLLKEQKKNGDWIVASRTEAQFERLYLIHDPPQDDLTDDDLAKARAFQKKHFEQPDEKRGGLEEARKDPHPTPEMLAHRKVSAQFVSFMATNAATQALIPLCAAK